MFQSTSFFHCQFVFLQSDQAFFLRLSGLINWDNAFDLHSHLFVRACEIQKVLLRSQPNTRSITLGHSPLLGELKEK